MSNSMDDMINRMHRKYTKQSKAEYDFKHKEEIEREERARKARLERERIFREQDRRRREEAYKAHEDTRKTYDKNREEFRRRYGRSPFEEFSNEFPFTRMLFGAYFEELFKRMYGGTANANPFASMFMGTPTDCFAKLEITDIEHTSEEEVIRNYRRLCLIHHPDKGGTEEAFVAITQAKNKCISYLNSRRMA